VADEMDTVQQERQAVLDHMDKADPAVWVLLMSNMAATLARYDQTLLAQLIGREAERRAERGGRRPAECLGEVLGDCCLEIRLER
jgi:hypothetical protein